MLRFLIIILCSVVFVVESVEGSECTVKANGKPGNCTFLDACTTLEDSTPQTVCGKKRGEKVVCCPFPAAPDGGIAEKGCMVEATGKPGNCSFIADCTTLGNSTTELCGMINGEPVICCPFAAASGRFIQDPPINRSTEIGCMVEATGKPGNCSFIADCTTLGNSTTELCGMKNGEPVICCPFAAASGRFIQEDRSTEIGDACIVETTKRPGRCSLTSNCDALADPTEQTTCGYTNERKKIICCPLPTSESRTCKGRQKCISERKCEEYNAISRNCTPNVGMIIGGVEAELKEFPHMALLGFKHKTGNYWMCGGSLISDQYILTAAHCVQGMEVFIPKREIKKRVINLARLGEHDYAEDNNERQDFGFTIIQHQDYNPTAKLNDIALLKLNEIVNFTEFIRPACLPTTFTPHRPDGIVTGWGTTAFMGPTSNILLKASLEFCLYNDCFRRYESEGLTIDNITQICALKEERDSCQGDSGGPLQTRHSLYDCSFIVDGIISYGIVCGKNIPSVYVRVFSYLNWIENEVWKTN